MTGYASVRGEVVSTLRTERRVVALRALQGCVRSGQREASGVVIKRGSVPSGRVVALFASLCEARLHVIRIRRALEVFQMARYAGIRADVVRALRAEGRVVTLPALQRGVSTRQRETRAVVIKRRIVPRGRVVALLAGSWQPTLYVVRIGCAIEVLHMAGSTIGRRAYELAINVAQIARNSRVRTGQRELGEGVVIERRRIPRARVVALLARGREVRLCVRRVVRLIEIREVASDASSRSSSKLAACVARVAIQTRVSPG